MPSLSAASLYPVPSEAALSLEHVGKRINDVQAPAAILDVAVVRRNCRLMLETAKTLGLGFRAHVKTHKTTQLARLQVGEDSQRVNFIASTISEVENLAPYLLECRRKGRSISLFYGLPIGLSHIARLGTVARLLGPKSVGLLIDHPQQVDYLSKIEESVWPGQIPVFAKIDVGYARAGVTPESRTVQVIGRRIAAQSKVVVMGAYAHSGGSYKGNTPQEALEFLRMEIEGVVAGADNLRKTLLELEERLTISFGATPTVTALQNHLSEGIPGFEGYRALLKKVKQTYDVEMHAGVYPVLDMQQLATRARPAQLHEEPWLSFDNLGLRILVEVHSVYEERERPEALIGAGSIVLGREPCKSYPGWGVVTPWQDDVTSSNVAIYDPEGPRTGWIVGHISQEHGVLTWEGPQDGFRKLELGQKLTVWPNHACMAGSNLGFYLIVDSDTDGPDMIQDVWVRWRGW